MRSLWQSVWPGLLWLAAALPLQAQTRYKVTFPEAAQHYVQVEAHYPTGGAAQLELFLPVWTPGDYQLRDYSQHVDQLQAVGSDAHPLPLQTSSKSRWTVDCQGQSEVTLVYRVRGQRDLSIAENYADSGKVVLQGAATFISPVRPIQPTLDVQVQLPAGWKTVDTGLPPAPDGAPGHYQAKDFDQLADCPIVAGSPQRDEFQVEGVRHALVYLSQTATPLWDRARAGRDAKKIVEATYRLWRLFPFAQEPPHSYTFLCLQDSGGGLEHKNSTCLAWNQGYLSNRESDYQRWLDLVAHEYFHTWNGKNLRPVALGPFDYEAENLTPSLWIVEGLTHYYTDLVLLRAGVATGTDYLKNLSANISRGENRRGMSLIEASMRTWEPGSKLASYRSGGAVVGFLLDQKIRQATGGRASLDDVLRQAYQQYSGERGYTEEQFEAVASQVAGLDLSDFFHRYVHGTEAPDLTPALLYYGLRWNPDTPEWKQLQIDPEASAQSRARWEGYLKIRIARSLRGEASRLRDESTYYAEAARPRSLGRQSNVAQCHYRRRLFH